MSIEREWREAHHCSEKEVRLCIISQGLLLTPYSTEEAAFRFTSEIVGGASCAPASMRRELIGRLVSAALSLEGLLDDEDGLP